MPVVHSSLVVFLQDFGANVAARRRQLGLSQTQLAAMVDIGQDVLSRIESGQAAPKFRRIPDFANALQCSTAALFANATDEERERGRLLAELIHPLPHPWQSFMTDMAEQMARTIRATCCAGEEPDAQAEIEEELDTPGSEG